MKAKFGRYIFLKKLAVGGMAEIFLARRVSFGGFAKFVVIKRLLPEYKGKSTYERLFLSEARTGALIHHPNIVSLYDLGQLDEQYFMAMEYVHGVSAAEMLNRAAQEKKPVPLGVAIRIGIGVSNALQYAHHSVDHNSEPLRIIHHDITPQNIELSFDGDVKLLDFGVATQVGRPSSGGRRGKPGFISPEALRREPLDGRSDLYSLGVVLYELSTGRRIGKALDGTPFSAESIPEFLPPTQLDERYPRSLEDALLPVIALERETRPDSGATLAKTLRETAEKLDLDTSAEALAAYLLDLMGAEIEARRSELADLGRRSDPVRRQPPAGSSITRQPPAGSSIDGDAVPSQESGEGEAPAEGVSDTVQAQPGEPAATGEYDPPPDDEATNGGFSEAEGAFSMVGGGLYGEDQVPRPPASRSVFFAVLAVALTGVGWLVGQTGSQSQAKHGVLSITTDPPGARAYDSGKLLGLTPFEALEVELDHRIDLRIKMPGHVEWKSSVTLTKDAPQHALSVVLKPGT